MLPGKKALHPSDTLIEVILVHATEQPQRTLPKSAQTFCSAIHLIAAIHNFELQHSH
jgi:hypothetical protein